MSGLYYLTNNIIVNKSSSLKDLHFTASTQYVKRNQDIEKKSIREKSRLVILRLTSLPTCQTRLLLSAQTEAENCSLLQKSELGLTSGAALISERGCPELPQLPELNSKHQNHPRPSAPLGVFLASSGRQAIMYTGPHGEANTLPLTPEECHIGEVTSRG